MVLLCALTDSLFHERGRLFPPKAFYTDINAFSNEQKLWCCYVHLLTTDVQYYVFSMKNGGN